MKKLSKLLSLLMAMALCLSLAPAAFAAEVKGSITVENTQEGKDYTVYKIFEATVSTTGQIAYFATENQANKYKEMKENPFTFSGPIAPDGKYSVTKTEGKSDEDVIKFLTDNLNSLPDVVEGNTISGTGNPITFENLDFGYYYIKSNTGSVVTITSTDPEADVYDKNQEITDKKEVNAGTTEDPQWGETNTAAIGDTIQYKITVTSAYYDGENSNKITNYKITDVLKNGLAYQMEGGKLKPLTVTVGGNPLTEGTDFTIDVSTTADGKPTFTINIPWTNAETGDFLYGLNDVIEVTYNATLTEDAKVGPAPEGGNVNGFTLKWDREDKSEGGHQEHETKTYTYSFDLVKTDGDNTVLSGAKFRLYATNPLDADGNLMEDADPIKLVKKEDGSYRLAVAGETEGVVTEIEAGNVTIAGLDENTTYYLVETEAPAGYNPLPGVTEVKIVEGKNNSATVENGKWTSGGVQVINNAGNLLPSTGGIGTTIFYIVGGVLVVAALVLFITKKRMNGRD